MQESKTTRSLYYVVVIGSPRRSRSRYRMTEGIRTNVAARVGTRYVSERTIRLRSMVRSARPDVVICTGRRSVVVVVAGVASWSQTMRDRATAAERTAGGKEGEVERGRREACRDEWEESREWEAMESVGRSREKAENEKERRVETEGRLERNDESVRGKEILCFAEFIMTTLVQEVDLHPRSAAVVVRQRRTLRGVAGRAARV
jgi:hypothetical protein